MSSLRFADSGKQFPNEFQLFYIIVNIIRRFDLENCSKYLNKFWQDFPKQLLTVMIVKKGNDERKMLD